MIRVSNWDNFHRDLHYKYTQWVLKSFNNAELYYLRVLRDGVDNTINAGIGYVNNNFDDLNSLHDHNDWTDYYHDDGELDSILTNVKESNINNGLEPVYDFYRTGGDLASAHLHKELVDTEATTIGLQLLSNFIRTVIDSINSELIIGLTQLIGQSVEDNDLETFASNMMDAPYTSGYNKYHLEPHLLKQQGLSLLSTDTRCIYTAKTEYARSVNTGLLQQYENYGVLEYDWVTSGLPNTCNTCKNIESNNPYSLEDIMNIGCPNHPNCICSVMGRLPVNISLNPHPRVVDLTPK